MAAVTRSFRLSSMHHRRSPALRSTMAKRRLLINALAATAGDHSHQAFTFVKESLT